VTEGTLYADSAWVLTTNDAITLGTTSLAFTQYSGAGLITAGTGLTKTGSTLALDAGNLPALTAAAYLEADGTFAYAASVTLDVAAKNDYAQSDTLTGACAISFSNAAAGRQGCVYAKQDGTGSRAVTINTVAGYTLIKDPGTDLSANPAAGSVTMWTYAFHSIGGTNYQVMQKQWLT
jgi:hypothetical protein